MAKLTSNGIELFRAEYACSRVAYMSNGKILRNCGDGWKSYRRLKPGVDAANHAAHRKAQYEQFLEACPSWARFIQLMSDAPLSKRHLLLAVIEMMPGDADGVWSHANDDLDLGLSIEDCVELCENYVAGMRERVARKEAAK